MKFTDARAVSGAIGRGLVSTSNTLRAKGIKPVGMYHPAPPRTANLTYLYDLAAVAELFGYMGVEIPEVAPRMVYPVKARQ